MYVDFQKLDDGYWYINAINDYRRSINTEGDIINAKRSIRVTSINHSTKSANKNRISYETDLYKYPTTYNLEFWESYNAPPETEEEKRIKEELIQLEGKFKK